MKGTMFRPKCTICINKWRFSTYNGYISGVGVYGYCEKSILQVHFAHIVGSLITTMWNRCSSSILKRHVGEIGVQPFQVRMRRAIDLMASFGRIWGLWRGELGRFDGLDAEKPEHFLLDRLVVL